MFQLEDGAWLCYLMNPNSLEKKFLILVIIDSKMPILLCWFCVVFSSSSILCSSNAIFDESKIGVGEGSGVGESVKVADGVDVTGVGVGVEV